MAKRPTGKRRPKTATPVDMSGAVIDAAMARIARDGWRRLSLADVAADAGVPLADVLIPFPTKYALVNAFQDRIDARMLAAADTHAASGDAGIDTRDRLFDLLMERLDALRSLRAAARQGPGPGLCRCLPGVAGRRRGRPGEDHGGPGQGPSPGRGGGAGSQPAPPQAAATQGCRRGRVRLGLFFFIALQYKS